MDMFSRDPLRGMVDLYPEDVRVEHWMIDKIKDVLSRYAYEEFEAPLLEPLEIFAAKSSEELVNEQSFIVEKKKDKKLILRPELTPQLARIVARKYNELTKPIRWFSNPTCYRYERPQRGRRREFKQFNADILGENSLLAEAEIFSIVVDIMTSFGVTEDEFQVYYNNRRFVDEVLTQVLGIPERRVPVVYKILDKREKMSEREFIAYIQEYFQDAAIEDGLLRFSEITTVDDLPFGRVPENFCENRGYQEVSNLQAMLEEIGISKYCTFQPGVIRGLDYYTGTVFEVFDTGTENRRSLFGGGRYDNLMGLFSNQEVSGIGFGMGLVPFQLYLETYNKIPETVSERDWSTIVYVMPLGDDIQVTALALARELRQAGVQAYMSFSPKKVGKQLGDAAAKGVKYAIILGSRELAQQQVSIKNLEKNEQEAIPLEKIASYCRDKLNLG